MLSADSIAFLVVVMLFAAYRTDGMVLTIVCSQRTTNIPKNKVRLSSACASSMVRLPICPGLSEQIVNLTIDEAHTLDKSEIPINSLMIDLTKDSDLGDEIGGNYVRARRRFFF